MSKPDSESQKSENTTSVEDLEIVNRRLGDDDEWDEKQPSCWSRFVHCIYNCDRLVLFLGVLLKLAFIDVKARKWSFCLGFFSVFVVVLLCVVLFSTLTNLPIVFLRLGEVSVGQIDLSINPGGQFAAASSINYSLVEELFPPEDEVRSYHTPRITWRSTIANFKTCPKLSNVSSLWYLPSGLPCLEDCLKHHCEAGNVRYPVFAIDQLRERRMGLASDWNVPMLKQGEVILSRNVAIATNKTVVGDTVVLYGSVDTVFGEMFVNVPVVQSKPTVMMGMKVVAIVDMEPLKFGSTDFIVMDFNSAAYTVAKSLSPYFFENESDELSQFDPKWCASSVYFNMNPDKRFACYKNSEFTVLQQTVVEWVSSIVETLGFNQVEAGTPILMFLRKLKFFSLFMGLIVSSVLVSIGILSLLLIYSLLNVGVKTRCYELGIQRMLGFTKPKLALMVLFSAYLFAIPACITGLVLGQLIFLLLRTVVSNVVGARLPPGVPLAAIGWGTAAGLLLPLFGSIIPIINVVSKKLPDILDVNRGGNTGIIYKIIKAKDYKSKHRIMFGLGVTFAFFGLLLYYFFPLGLINMNLSILLNVFFTVLFGMLVGLVLLALNLERIFHVAVTKICFFWEKQAVLMIVNKSLIAHKLRNRKITLMYAVAMSCIIFITVLFQTQLTSVKFDKRREYGSEVVAHVPLDVVEVGALATAVLNSSGKLISGITYVSFNVENVRGLRFFKFMTLGRFKDSYLRAFFAVPPNFFDIIGDEFLRVDMHHPLTQKYGIGESLYVDGEYRVAISTSSYEKLRMKSLDDSFILDTWRSPFDPLGRPAHIRLPVKSTAILSSAPALDMSRFAIRNSDIIASFPTTIRFTGSDYLSVRGITIDRVFFKVPEKKNIRRVAQIVNFEMTRLFGRGYVFDIEDALSQFDIAEDIINYFLISAQVGVLVICSFSLFSSMTANVMDSSKEIGVYRCIGMTKSHIHRAFMWESFVVVVVGGLLGVTIGIIIGYTLYIQNMLLTQISMPFSFPYIQVIIVVVMALVASICSSYTPVAFLLNQRSITRIFQRTL